MRDKPHKSHVKRDEASTQKIKVRTLGSIILIWQIYSGQEVVVNIHPADAVVPGIIPYLAPDIPVVVKDDRVRESEETGFQTKARSALVVVAVTRAHGIAEAQQSRAVAQRQSSLAV